MNPTVASNDHPDTLPLATTQALADAKARGEYLQTVDTHWSPPEIDEIYAFNSYVRANGGFRCWLYLNDYRQRHPSISVADLPDHEANLRDLKLPRAKEQQKLYERLSNLIQHTKEWRPRRRVVLELNYSDHDTDTLIKYITDATPTFPSLAPKLVDIINMRKTAMAEVNAQRGNPIRHVCLQIYLTPMDYCANATWTIHRTRHEGDEYNEYTHHHHTTQYNLRGDVAVEYVSKEEQRRRDNTAEDERLKALRKTPYENYHLVSTYDINRMMEAVEKKKDKKFNRYDVFDKMPYVNDEHIETGTRYDGSTYTTTDVYDLIVSNVDYEAQTFEIGGYVRRDNEGRMTAYPSKIKSTIQYPPKNKRAKQSQMEKDVKPFMQNTPITSLVPPPIIIRIRRVVPPTQ